VRRSNAIRRFILYLMRAKFIGTQAPLLTAEER
jgi:hypothetical protein